MSGQDSEVRSAAGAVFTQAKCAAGAAGISELAALVLGFWLSLIQAPQWSTTGVLGMLALLSYTLRGWAEDCKDQGDDLSRLIELSDGLGRSIPAPQRADALARLPSIAEWIASWRKPEKAYFASTTPASPRRLVEIVRESAWWTSHVGATAEHLQHVWITLFALLSVTALAVGAMRGGVSLGLLTAPPLAIAILLFLLTSGPHRRLRQLKRFRGEATRVAADATALLKHSTAISEPDALSLAAEYHLARKGSPLLSGIAWWARQKKLNRLWNENFHDEVRSAGA